jgi:hypothetical protein
MTTEEYYEEKMKMPITELIDEMFALDKTVTHLIKQLRNATLLLHDCGYFYKGNRWVDSENMEEEE